MSIAEKLIAYVNANRKNLGDGDTDSLLEMLFNIYTVTARV